jgi:predicted nucleotidyltransferase
MNALILHNRDKIIEICVNRNIVSLTLFGSATGDQFNPTKSDIDFLVEFGKMEPGDHAKQFFGFIEDMEKLLHLPVDVIEPSAIRNPYFRSSVQESKELIYVRA